MTNTGGDLIEICMGYYWIQRVLYGPLSLLFWMKCLAFFSYSFYSREHAAYIAALK